VDDYYSGKVLVRVRELKHETGEPIRLYDYKLRKWIDVWERGIRLMEGPKHPDWEELDPTLRWQPYGRRNKGLDPHDKTTVDRSAVLDGVSSERIGFDLGDPKHPRKRIHLAITSFNCGGPDKPHEPPPKLHCPGCGRLLSVFCFLDWED
jgi:hypothetical protein